MGVISDEVTLVKMGVACFNLPDRKLSFKTVIVLDRELALKLNVGGKSPASTHCYWRGEPGETVRLAASVTDCQTVGMVHGGCRSQEDGIRGHG